MTTQLTEHQLATDPRHTYLSAQEVIAQFGWGRTKGYLMLNHDITGFPRSIGGRYRLDTVMDWEDAVLEGRLDAQLPSRVAAAAAPTVPAPRRGKRAA